MYIVIEETGDFSIVKEEKITDIMEEEYENGTIDIICIKDESPNIYNGNGKWGKITEKEVY